jgi:hypothetical protein
MEPSINSVYGNNVLIVGDMHLSDVYTGRHKNYLQNCFKCLGDVERNVKDTQPCAVVFLGDLVGVNEGNIRNREVLNMICKSFKTMNSVCSVTASVSPAKRKTVSPSSSQPNTAAGLIPPTTRRGLLLSLAIVSNFQKSALSKP